jgi:hypothetical protein
MGTFVPFSRDQSFLLPPDMRDWLPQDDLAHFVVAAVERVPLGSFQAKAAASGVPSRRLLENVGGASGVMTVSAQAARSIALPDVG